MFWQFRAELPLSSLNTGGIRQWSVLVQWMLPPKNPFVKWHKVKLRTINIFSEISPHSLLDIHILMAKVIFILFFSKYTSTQSVIMLLMIVFAFIIIISILIIVMLVLDYCYYFYYCWTFHYNPETQSWLWI